MQDELPNPGGRLERQELRMPECLAVAVLAASSVQVCPFGPTCGGRLLSGPRRTVVSKEGISRFFLGGRGRLAETGETPVGTDGESDGARAWAASSAKGKDFQKLKKKAEVSIHALETTMFG